MKLPNNVKIREIYICSLVSDYYGGILNKHNWVKIRSLQRWNGQIELLNLSASYQIKKHGSYPELLHF